MLLTSGLSAKRRPCDLAMARRFAAEAMGSRVTWPASIGHIVRPKGLGGPPG